jgi:sulfur carrier protein ThiS
MPEVQVTVRGREKARTKKIRTRSSLVFDAVREAGINPLEVLIKVNGEFVPDTARLRKGDRVELMEITSRG